MSQFAGFIEQAKPRKLHAFGDGRARHTASPGFDDFLCCHAPGQFVQNLPHHDPRPFERRFPVADVRVGHDVLAQFDPFGPPEQSLVLT